MTSSPNERTMGRMTTDPIIDVRDCPCPFCGANGLHLCPNHPALRPTSPPYPMTPGPYATWPPTYPGHPNLDPNPPRCECHACTQARERARLGLPWSRGLDLALARAYDVELDRYPPRDDAAGDLMTTALRDAIERTRAKKIDPPPPGGCAQAVRGGGGVIPGSAGPPAGLEPPPILLPKNG